VFSWSTIVSGSDFQKTAKAVQASHDKSRIQQDHKPNSACMFLIFETSFHGRIAGGQMVPRSRSRGILKAGRRRLTRRELGKDITSASRVLHNLQTAGESPDKSLLTAGRHVLTLLFLGCSAQKRDGYYGTSAFFGRGCARVKSEKDGVSPQVSPPASGIRD
jgi:hypothetical protein